MSSSHWAVRARPLARYGTAAASVLLAAGCLSALEPAVGGRFPFQPFFLAVLLTAWAAGWRPAAAAAALGGVALGILAFPARPAAAPGWYVPLAFALYAVVAGGIVLFARATGRAAEAAADHRRRLEQEAADRAKTEESLRDREALLRALGDNLPGGFVYQGEKGTDGVARMRHVSAGVERVLGVPAAEVMADPMAMYGLILPDELPRVMAAEEAAFAGGTPFDCEFRMHTRGGGVVWLHARSAPRRLPGGGPLVWDGVAFDVTARKRAEEAVRAGVERERARAEEFETVLRAVPAAVWVAHDPACRTVTGSRLSYQMLQLPEGANASMTAPEGERPDRFRVFREDGSEFAPEALPLQRAARGEPQRGVVEHLRFAAGGERWLVGNAEPLFDAGGRPRGAVAAFMDISDMVAAQDALKEQDRRKDEFLATLAHELRNPLAPIRNALHVLKLSADPADAARARDTMERQLAHLVRLVDDLLDLSRISRNALQLKPGRIDLADAVASAVEASRPLAEAAGVTLAVDLPAGPVPLDADLTRLAQVFTNLLNNAAKFTEAGGAIAVRGGVAAGAAVVRVTDSGLGIPADALPRVFDMFTQADHARDRSRGGLGIGLALVKRLVELHGGTVEARSGGPGTGSEFVVQLPLASDAGTTLKDEPMTPAEPGTDGHPPPLKILVADDNVDAAVSLGIMLELAGHEIRTAHDGAEAVRAADEFRPDVAVLDIGMPHLTGYEVARRVRQREWGAGVTLIALTGWGQADDRRKSKEAGFDHHLTKPADPAVLDGLLSAVRPAGRP